MQVELVIWDQINQINNKEFTWPLGNIWHCKFDVPSAIRVIAQTMESYNVNAILFWDSIYGNPDPELIRSLLDEKVDIWHAGILLGVGSQPDDLDYISPTWLFNRDPSPNHKSISWRLSLRVLLIRTSVIKEIGFLDPAVMDIDFAGLEFGYRAIWRGAFIYHEPNLVRPLASRLHSQINKQDRYVFLLRNFKSIWTLYILIRRILGLQNPLLEIKNYVNAKKYIGKFDKPTGANQHICAIDKVDIPENHLVNTIPKISVLIPTLQRYEYLKSTLSMLQQQTLKPFEIICVDQTPEFERQPDLYNNYPDLHIVVIWLDEPGQCSARNTGLEHVHGELVSFLDDDVIIQPDHLENLWLAMKRFNADIVNGVWAQGNKEAVSLTDRYIRLSDRLDTGNSLAWLHVILQSGGFDLNYNRNYRADADLGMRLYLSGSRSIIAPNVLQTSISPPTGGLKFFHASATSNKIKPFQPWPSITQSYYWMRYFSPRQIREAYIQLIILSIIPQSTQDTSTWIRILKYILSGLLVLPFRLVGLMRSHRGARKMLKMGPQIPGIRNPNFDPSKQAV